MESKFFTKEEMFEFDLNVMEHLANARLAVDFLEDNIDRPFHEWNLEQSRYIVSELIKREKVYVSALEKAKERIDNGTYGICRVTGENIGREILLRVPHKTISKAGFLLLEEERERIFKNKKTTNQ